MYLLGHVGIGPHLLPPMLRARLSWRWLALGCLLPDLLDKPLALAAHFALRLGPVHFEGLRRTRLAGHTLLMLLVLASAATLLRSSRWWALALGALTHVLLDLAADLIGGVTPGWLLWPLLGRDLPAGGGAGGVPTLLYRLYIGAEILGAALLAWDFARRRRLRQERCLKGK